MERTLSADERRKDLKELDEVFGNGKWQRFQSWVFLFIITFLEGSNCFQLLFIVHKPDHLCRPPDGIIESFNYTQLSSHPKLFQKCKIANYSSCSISRPILPGDSTFTDCFDENDLIDCRAGVEAFAFNTEASDFFHSLSVDREWLCDRGGIGAEVLTAQNVGMILTMALTLSLGDTWGRRPTFFLLIGLSLVLRLISLFVTEHHYAYLTVIAMGSTFFPSAWRMAYTLVAECCNDRGRLEAYIASWVSWVFGICCLSLVAWLTGSWFHYGLVTTIPYAVFILFWWTLPESPRFLLSKGRSEEAEAIVKKIRKTNGQPIPANLKDLLARIELETDRESSFRLKSLFSNRRMTEVTIILTITWCVNDFLFYAGQLNVENLAGNFYWNFVAVALTELPSVFVGEFLIQRYGRRWSGNGLMIIATAALAICVPLSAYGSEQAVVGLSITSKVASNICWFIMYVQCVELYPTDVRISGTNFSSLIAAIVAVAAPAVVHLGDNNLSLMYGIFTIVGCIGVISTSFIPETLGEPLLENVEDIRQKKKYPYFSFKVWE